MAVAVIMKVFQIATDMGEIKELLKEIRHNTLDPNLLTVSTQESPETLMRAVRAESYPEPSSIEPERQ